MSAARTPSASERTAARTRDLRIARAEAGVIEAARGYLKALAARAGAIARGVSGDELAPFEEAVVAAFYRMPGAAIELGEAEK